MGGEGLVGVAVQGRCRRDAQQRQSRDSLRMVKGQAMRDARAAIMAHQGKAVVPERPHDLDLIAGHNPLGIGQVVAAALPLAAIAIVPEVGGDHREPLGQARRDLAPSHVGVWMAVKQEQRRTIARGRGPDAHAVCDGDVME